MYIWCKCFNNMAVMFLLMLKLFLSVSRMYMDVKFQMCLYQTSNFCNPKSITCMAMAKHFQWNLRILLLHSGIARYSLKPNSSRCKSPVNIVSTTLRSQNLSYVTPLFCFQSIFLPHCGRSQFTHWKMIPVQSYNSFLDQRSRKIVLWFHRNHSYSVDEPLQNCNMTLGQ